MFNFKLVDRIILLALTVAAPIGVAILTGLGPDAVKRWLLEPRLDVNLWAVVLAVLAGLYVCNRVVFIERERRFTLEAALHAIEGELKDSVGALQRDVVTGIPNQLKLEADIEALAQRIKRPDACHLIMIDLDGFGAVNDRFGYQKGDAVIRYIAGSIYGSMRRDEEAYKRPFAGQGSYEDLWRRIYRKYSGGDEFVFLIKGSEAEALGFLARLKRRFELEFTGKVAEILDSPWPLRFHAGVCPLYPGDSFASAVQRVEECLRLARQTGSPTSVYWMSRQTAADFPPGGEAARAYAQAEAAFSLAETP